MKTAIVFAVSAFVLAGCGLTPQGDAFRQAVAQQGAEAADEGLVNARWFICNAATVGSIKRAYGRSPESAETYRAFCAVDEANGDIVAPLPE